MPSSPVSVTTSPRALAADTRPSEILTSLDGAAQKVALIGKQEAAAYKAAHPSFHPTYLRAVRASEASLADHFKDAARSAWAASKGPLRQVLGVGEQSVLGAGLLLFWLCLIGGMASLIPALLVSKLMFDLVSPEILLVPLFLLYGARVAWFATRLPVFFVQIMRAAAEATITPLTGAKVFLFVPMGASGDEKHPIWGYRVGSESGELSTMNYFDFTTGNTVWKQPLLMVHGDKGVIWVQSLQTGELFYWADNVPYFQVRGRRLAECLQESFEASSLAKSGVDWALAEHKRKTLATQYGNLPAVRSQLAQLESTPGARMLLPLLSELTTEYAYGLANGAPLKPCGHIVLMGNPGTGKTRLARSLAAFLHCMGISPNDAFIEAAPNTMIGTAHGETQQKTMALLQKAAGGTLFIDEAYALVNSESARVFGEKAVETLLKHMEDNRTNLTIIAAGYSREMSAFLSANPGLDSRFKHKIELSDFDADDLLAVLKELAGQQHLALSENAEGSARRIFQGMVMQKTRNFGNAREARSLLERAHSSYKRRALAGQAREHQAYSGFGLLEAVDFADSDTADDREAVLKRAVAELDAMTGLEVVKDQINKVRLRIEYQRKQGKAEPFAKHFLFVGPPGTGKTTVARNLANLLYGLGALPTNKLVTVDQSGLVAGHVGQTAIKTNEVCDRAMGGVLFIDEAYSLVEKSSEHNFSKQAIETLMQRLENDRGKFVVVAAGYDKEMGELLSSNPGLKSRFTEKLQFTDYTPEQMLTIFNGLCKSKTVALGAGVQEAALRCFVRMHKQRTKDFANARNVRTFFEQATERMEVRIVEESVSGPAVLLPRDLDDEVHESEALLREEALQELNGMTGLNSVKAQVQQLVDTIEYDQMQGSSDLIAQHYVFTGNPGTGKTTVARLLARVLFSLGCIPTDRVVEVDRSGLVAGYVGQTALKTNAVVDSALGGVLFIDEAYALAERSEQHNLGKEAIDTLLKRMEDDRGKFVVIAAGYSGQMQTFLDSNEGLRSRFTNFIGFEDYSPSELLVIAKQHLTPNRLDVDAEKLLSMTFERRYARPPAGFANGREARNVAATLAATMKSRIVAARRVGTDVAALAGVITRDDVVAALGLANEVVPGSRNIGNAVTRPSATTPPPKGLFKR